MHNRHFEWDYEGILKKSLSVVCEMKVNILIQHEDKFKKAFKVKTSTLLLVGGR